MTTSPTWQAPSVGYPTKTGQINQMLTAHSSSFYYTGVAPSGCVDPTSITAPATSDNAGQGALSVSFTPTSGISLAHVSLALQKIGAGCDLLLTIQPDDGTNTGKPAGATLTTAVDGAYALIPAEWIGSSAPTALTDLAPLPLVARPNLTSGTTYYVVIAPYANCVPLVNDVMWGRSGGGQTGVLAKYNGSTWAVTASAQFATYFRYGNSGSFVATVEDTGSLVKSYRYSAGALTQLRTWASSQANPNLLCRDDAAFDTGIGTWVASSNASVALSSNTLAVTATGTSPVVRVGYYGGANQYAATAGTQYTFTALVKAASTTRSAVSTISFYDASGTQLASTSGASVTDSTSVWKQVSATAVAPTNTAYVRAVVAFMSAVTSEVHYVDQAMIALGSFGTWNYPQSGVSSSRTLTYSSGILTTVS